jgi:hypothetical protein
VFDKRVAQTSEWPTFKRRNHFHHQQHLSQQPNNPSPSKAAREILALQALQTNPKLNVQAATTIYKIPRKTLGRRRDSQPARRDIPANSRKFTDLKEETIVQYIIELSTRAFPPRLCYVEDMANQLRRKRNTPPIGKH